MNYKNKWLEQINSQRDAYRQLCRNEPSICIFLKDYWQDAVCNNDQWSAVLYEKGGKVYGSLVFCYKVVRKGIIIQQPILTQTNGIWIREYTGTSYYKKLEYEKEVLTSLISKLEDLPVMQYKQHFTVEITNWLPFYWKGFLQTTRYTYRINDISDVEAVIATFTQAKRKNLRHAAELGIEVKFDLPAQEFYYNHKMTLEKQKCEIAYSFDTLNRIYSTIYRENCGTTVYAIDSSGNIHAALLIIWDNATAFDLISTIDPDYRNSGAATLLVKAVLDRVSEMGLKVFDFEGSMIEGVENSFRQFGTIQTPYFSISKDYRTNLDKVCDRVNDMVKVSIRKGMRLLHGRK